MVRWAKSHLGPKGNAGYRVATAPMHAGTFVTRYGQHVDFDGAKGEDAVLPMVGEGSGTSSPAEAK